MASYIVPALGKSFDGVVSATREGRIKDLVDRIAVQDPVGRCLLYHNVAG